MVTNEDLDNLVTGSVVVTRDFAYIKDHTIWLRTGSANGYLSRHILKHLITHILEAK